MMTTQMKIHFNCSDCGVEESFDLDGGYPEAYFKKDLEDIGWLPVMENNEVEKAYCKKCRKNHE